MSARPERHALLCVPADHPALPGHFPGHPVVPGVVILDELLALARDWLGPVAVIGLPRVKFASPLSPGVRADVHLGLYGSRLKFRVEMGGHALAQGEFVLAYPPSDLPEA
jgi:3-hydroxyacyl-[acyl-carrier-protein] dehydratase